MDRRDNCDWCNQQAELYHNERMGISLCENCDKTVDELTRDGIVYENFLKAALASMEMRHERGFSLDVSIFWIKAVHSMLYGDNSQAVMTARIDAARERMNNNESHP